MSAQKRCLPEPVESTGPALRCQPSADLRQLRGHLNADVRDAIAEFAVDAVNTSLALRRVSRGWRLSTDSRLRCLVIEDQPALLSSQPDCRATLLLRPNPCMALDGVRVALTCDTFHRICRLVAVSFALDGAKDEIHEGHICGPRRVDTADPETDVFGGLVSAWTTKMQMHGQLSRPVQACFLSSLVSVNFGAEYSMLDGLCRLVEGGAWPNVCRLEVRCAAPQGPAGREWMDGLEGRTSRLINALGPQLTHLYIIGATEAGRDARNAAVRRCGRLTTLIFQRCKLDAAEGLCDALLASGAPLEAVTVVAPVGDAARLIENINTITKAKLRDMHEIPPPAAARLVEFASNQITSAHAGKLPCADHIDVSKPEDLEEQSASVTSLNAGGWLHVVDLAARFPSLERVAFANRAEVDMAEVSYPTSLRQLRATSMDADFLAKTLAGLGKHPRPRMNDIYIGPGLNVAIEPLTGFASTLTRLHITGEYTTAESTAAAEAVVAQLHALVMADVPALHSSRCFLGGDHKNLRTLIIGSVEQPGSRFTHLVRACPRLCHVSLPHQTRSDAPLETISMPVGWVEEREFRRTLKRQSMVMETDDW